MANKRPKLLIFFAIWNFVLAFLAFGFILLMILPAYLRLHVPHHIEQPEAGIVSMLIMVIFPSFIAFLTFLAAGIGILRKRAWGFYFHVAGTGMASLTMILAPYSVISFILSFKPYFKGEFFPELKEWGNQSNREQAGKPIKTGFLRLGDSCSLNKFT